MIESIFKCVWTKCLGQNLRSPICLLWSEGGVSPTGVFYPWARWGWGPGQIPELLGRRRNRRNRWIFLKNAKTVFDDETYLEKRLGIVKHVIV